MFGLVFIDWIRNAANELLPWTLRLQVMKGKTTYLMTHFLLAAQSISQMDTVFVLLAPAFLKLAMILSEHDAAVTWPFFAHE